VQEETNLDILLALLCDLIAQHGWQKHEVVVVYPDQVIVLDVSSNGLCEQLVCFCICGPCRLVEGNLTGMVVEERPEDRVLIMLATEPIMRGLAMVTYSRIRCNVYLRAHHRA
jgi:hypothetical protein